MPVSVKESIIEWGADIVGFADLSKIPSESRYSFDYGISIAKAINPKIVSGISEGPNQDYFREYQRLNSELDKIALLTTKRIKDMGYKAIAITTTEVALSEDLCTNLPHKTVATRAGLGWIGKSALLITKDYGPAIRLTTVLTDLQLPTGTPINDSKCGNCTLCKNVCEGKAIKGVNWNVGMKREEFYDAIACKKEARRKCDLKNINTTICGQCINICPYTRRYMKLSGIESY
jgi:epoxyqueuosine reductase QueG